MFVKKRILTRGWTFIETLIVMSIVLILSASVGFTSIKQIDKARVVSAKSQIESFSLALDSYYLDTGTYPSESEGLEALYSCPNSTENWEGPYLSKSLPNDPWGNPYVYYSPSPEGSDYGICSYGKDGIEGGEDYDKDILSWE